MSPVASEHLGESLGTDFFSVREQFTPTVIVVRTQLQQAML